MPQIMKLIKTKSSEDISLRMYILTWFAVVLLDYKSIILNDNDLIISNSISLLLITSTIILIIRFRIKQKYKPEVSLCKNKTLLKNSFAEKEVSDPLNEKLDAVGVETSPFKKGKE